MNGKLKRLIATALTCAMMFSVVESPLVSLVSAAENNPPTVEEGYSGSFEVTVFPKIRAGFRKSF